MDPQQVQEFAQSGAKKPKHTRWPAVLRRERVSTSQEGYGSSNKRSLHLWWAEKQLGMNNTSNSEVEETTLGSTSIKNRNMRLQAHRNWVIVADECSSIVGLSTEHFLHVYTLRGKLPGSDWWIYHQTRTLYTVYWEGQLTFRTIREVWGRTTSVNTVIKLLSSYSHQIWDITVFLLCRHSTTMDKRV